MDKNQTKNKGTYFVDHNSAYINAMTDAYLECAWWADSPEEQRLNNVKPTKRTRQRAQRDCEVWCQAAIAKGLNLTHASKPNLIRADEAGHNLWLTRQGHGTGFWDNNPNGTPARDGAVYRWWDDATGEVATAIAKAMGEVYLYVVGGRYFNIEGGKEI